MMATGDVFISAPFTYNWIIENVTEMTSINFTSPFFIAKTISEVEWCLHITDNSDICCYLLEENDNDAGENYLIDFEFSFLATDGSSLITKAEFYKKNNNVFMITKTAFSLKWREFIPNNTLTIQFKMWKRGCDIMTVDFCYARTILKKHTGTFLWPIKQFSTLKENNAENFSKLASDEKRVFPLKGLTQKGPFMALVLYLKRFFQSEEVCVTLLIERGKRYAFSCEISVMGALGEVIATQLEKYGECSYWGTLNFPCLISKSKLLANKNLFLVNDTLVLKCSFEVLTGDISNEIEYCTSNIEPVVKLSLEDMLQSIYERDPIRFEEYFSKEVSGPQLIDNSIVKDTASESSKYSCPLSASLGCLYTQETLSDVTLRAGTKLYPVHKSVLCSRCPAFESTLSHHKAGDIIEIKDMDENILLLLLRYLYTDTIDVQFEKNLELYKVAVNYKLFDLKAKCSDFFIKNLNGYTFGDIKSLANKYQDEELKIQMRNRWYFC